MQADLPHFLAHLERVICSYVMTSYDELNFDDELGAVLIGSTNQVFLTPH